MNTKSLSTGLILALLFTFSSASNASPSVIITDINQVEYSKLSVPADLTWSASALYAAKREQQYVYGVLKQELEAQRKSGAIRVSKIYRTYHTDEYKDWKKYVPEIRDYQIAGYSRSNLQKRVADLYQIGGPDLQRKLVYLKQDNCSLLDFNLFDIDTWFVEKCSITVGSPGKFLRAALRTKMAMGSAANQSRAWFRELVDACLRSEYPYKISNGIMNCPKLAKDSPGFNSIELEGYLLSGGWKFTVNQTKNTATLKYLPPKFQEWADTATWDANSKIVRFSDN
jgi:hypothetical protein